MNPAQCRAARALLDWTQPELAQAAGLGLSTIIDFERVRRALSEDAIRSIRDALETAGVEFTNGNQPGVRMNINWAFEGIAAIAAQLGISAEEAERLCVSKKLRTFRTNPDGPRCASREAISEFIAQHGKGEGVRVRKGKRK